MAKLGNLSIVDLTGQLMIGSQELQIKRMYHEINRIVVHHTAMDNAQIENIAKFHVKERNWNSIGYHFVINENGIIHQTSNLLHVTNHTKGFNRNAIGIALNGNYSKRPVPKRVIEILRALIKELVRLYLIKDINKHCDCCKTECPGLNFKTEYLDINKPLEIK